MIEANDLLQAVAKQRNDNADDAAHIMAELLTEKRQSKTKDQRIKELEAELATFRCPECKRFTEQGHYDDCPVGLGEQSLT